MSAALVVGEPKALGLEGGGPRVVRAPKMAQDGAKRAQENSK